MNASFYRAQAALCLRLSRSIPQERIAQELLKLAAEYDAKVGQLEQVTPAAMPVPQT